MKVILAQADYVVNVWNIGGITSAALYQVRMKPLLAVSCELAPISRQWNPWNISFSFYPLLRR